MSNAPDIGVYTEPVYANRKDQIDPHNNSFKKSYVYSVRFKSRPQFMSAIVVPVPMHSGVAEEHQIKLAPEPLALAPDKLYLAN